MKDSYFNTNNEEGDELIKSNIKAESQEEIILKIFKSKIRLTASKAWRLYEYQVSIKTPLTSIRRAITNLCSQGKIVKTYEKTMGIYEKKEYVYMFVPEIYKQIDLF